MWLKHMYIWTYNFCVICVWCFVFCSSELLGTRFKWQIFIVCMIFLVFLFNMFHIYILCPHQIKKVTNWKKNISHRIPSFIKTKFHGKKTNCTSLRPQCPTWRCSGAEPCRCACWTMVGWALQKMPSCPWSARRCWARTLWMFLRGEKERGVVSGFLPRLPWPRKNEVRWFSPN